MKKMRIESEFAIFVTVYFEFKRSDLDNAMKVILDSLQNCGVIKNDNQCFGIIDSLQNCGVIKNDNQCFGIITEKKISKRPKIEFELMPMFEFEKVINFTKELISSQEGK
jgi:Holliday junction resolvase RusA-like endonuclease